MSRSKILRRLIKVLFIGIVLLATGIFLFFTVTTAVTGNIDSYTYNLPFKEGAKFRVVQGYGGLFSHTHIAAVDFEMPAGTPVCAAREGLVYSYKDDSDEGGVTGKYKRKANYIMIRHDDGSYGCYWHLQKNSVLTKQGRVAKGQVIGLSGATGQVLRQHLHFSVKRKLNYEKDSFVRTKFSTTDGILLPEQGRVYERPGN